MSEINIIKKPDNISYKDIRELLHQAHQDNFARGIVLKTTQYSSVEMEERIRTKDGITFVAMDGDILTGTASCWPAEIKKWYHQGLVMKWMLIGVLPDYQGRHIASQLLKAVEEEARNRGINVIYFDTAEKNYQMRKVGGKSGFLAVDLFAPRSNHYSVAMLKWMDSCPFSREEVKRKYWKSVLKTKIKYKPGKIPRFGMGKNSADQGKRIGKEC